MNRLQTPLCDRLGIRLPIIQAPMASAATPEMAAAVCKAGGLGSLGAAYSQPEAMQRDAEAVRAQTDLPFNVNLFVVSQPPAVDAAAQRGALDAVAGYYQSLGLPAPEPVRAPYAPDLEAQLRAIEAIRPAVFSSHLGDLPAERVRRFQSQGIKVGGSANCVAEAERLEALGVDFIVAQGAEAGGHRGSYLRNPYESMTGTLALVRMIVCRVKTPVVAAGGIMDGAGIAAALALGAQAAQLGTAFIPCPESGAPQVHKDGLLAAREDTTVITEKFSGKPARGLANRFNREMRDAPQLPFPAQNALTGKLRAASGKAGNPDFVAMWAGQAAPLSRALPAGQLIATLEAETLECLDRLASLRR
ncbi:MAG TPA: nitronate monooxygenase [Burkholderiales bacterium]|jgi:nitronate monooxygenase|nr:nitronate monooxygenase [Burkholderiales bacterium]